MAETTNLITIGEFSSLTRLSVRMLRHYDAHGVLVPADVDPWTGYRRYAPHQLRDATDIRNLRDVGFGVSAISALLAARDTRPGPPRWNSSVTPSSRNPAPPRLGWLSSPVSSKEKPACPSPSTAVSSPP